MGKTKKLRGDVIWYSQKCKKPIAYSTISDSDSIRLINRPNQTAGKLMLIFKQGKYLVSQDMIKVIQAFIDKGYGDEVIITL